jgi:hypothetical protein
VIYPSVAKGIQTAAALGEIAYTAFALRAGKLTDEIDPPEWSDLPSVLKLAWIAGALAVWRVTSKPPTKTKVTPTTKPHSIPPSSKPQ